MGRRFSNILETIGDTPVVRINKLAPPGIELYVKLEAFNPMGSVKDRLALGVIEDAERRGELKPGQTIVEATSGNTGIGLAMVCAQKGYPLVVTMAENFSIERRKMLRFLGAKVVLTPAALKGSGMVAKAAELAEAHGWWQPRQFENPANAEIHARTTAVEILEAFEDTRLDYWVSGFGTGGTVNGVSRVLKERSPATRIAVCEPDNSRILGGGVAQPRNADGSPSGSHPLFRPHLMQGWSPDFVPKLAEEVMSKNCIDDFIAIDGGLALQYARDLAQQEGIFTGISGGATFAGTLKIAESADAGTTLLCMLPDTGERYLSTILFENIASEMTDDEQSIAASTPGYRFDTAAPSPAADDSAAPAVDKAALAEVEGLLADTGKPVVMFAMEWCEFCWSLRRMFAKYDIPYHSVDIDSVAYQQGNRGGQIREVLKSKTTWNTLPQIFIGGEFVGGCTDVFDGWRDGQLQQQLEKVGVEYNRSVSDDPYSFLPNWLHPRH